MDADSVGCTAMGRCDQDANELEQKKYIYVCGTRPSIFRRLAFRLKIIRNEL